MIFLKHWLIIGIASLSILLTSCSPNITRDPAATKGSETVHQKVLGVVPSDMCYINGEPQVMNYSYDYYGTNYSYVNTDGDHVLIVWDANGSITSRSILEGNDCP